MTKVATKLTRIMSEEVIKLTKVVSETKVTRTLLEEVLGFTEAVPEKPHLHEHCQKRYWSYNSTVKRAC